MSEESPLACQRRELREWFLEVLLARRPASVLDVGAGKGELIAALRNAGVEAVGVEPEPAAPHVIAASADALPFADASIDWVTLRHVPHHLPDCATAIREACRVAAIGVMLAEPCYELTLAGQRVGLEIDRALKALDRAAGRHHADCIPPTELAAMLSLPVDAVLARNPLRAWTADDFDDELARAGGPPLCGSVPDDPKLAALRSEVLAGRATLGGSTIVVATRYADASRV